MRIRCSGSVSAGSAMLQRHEGQHRDRRHVRFDAREERLETGRSLGLYEPDHPSTARDDRIQCPVLEHDNSEERKDEEWCERCPEATRVAEERGGDPARRESEVRVPVMAGLGACKVIMGRRVGIEEGGL